MQRLALLRVLQETGELNGAGTQTIRTDVARGVGGKTKPGFEFGCK